jgi:hypothetical protein
MRDTEAGSRELGAEVREELKEQEHTHTHTHGDALQYQRRHWKCVQASARGASEASSGERRREKTMRGRYCRFGKPARGNVLSEKAEMI